MQDNAYHGDHGYCAVNPTVGREKEFDNLPHDGNGRVVVVVGAGVAGLTCAEMLGRRGFKAIVLEKTTKSADKFNLPTSPRRKKNSVGASSICARMPKNSERKSF